MNFQKWTFITVPNKHKLKELSVYSKAIYLSLCAYADDKGQCYPAINTIAKECNCSDRSVIRYMQELIEKWLLSKEIRKKEWSCENISNLYQLKICGDSQSLGGDSQSPPPGDSQSQELNLIILTKSNELNIDTPKKISESFFDLKEDHEIWKEVINKHPSAIKDLRDFCNYWTEPNKSWLKVKWQLQETFDIKRRLYKWLDNSQKWNKVSPYNKPKWHLIIE